MWIAGKDIYRAIEGPIHVASRYVDYRTRWEGLLAHPYSLHQSLIPALLRKAEAHLNPFNAEDMVCVPPERLREAGLSLRKVVYIQGLAERVNSGSLSYEALATMSNDEVAATLMEIPGIGRWTAEIFLIFGLKRLDVLALGDTGLKRAAKMLYPKASSNGNALEKVSER